MVKNDKKIGILGGTFDPIHYGHLIIAEEVRQSFDLEKIIFIPSGMPPHKAGLRVTPAEHRYNMVYNAIKTNDCFEVSRIELERTGYTYTVDTLRQLKSLFGNDTKLFFIVGADIIMDLLTWKEPRKIFEMCEFIATVRPGYNNDSFINEIEYLINVYGVKINIAYLPLIEISSTSIREKVRNKKSIKYLVPDATEAYILENELYR